MASVIFILVEIGIIATQSAALYILGIEHSMIEDKKIWTEDPPSFLEFTGPILSVKTLIGNRGYNLGPHLEHSPARRESRVIEPNYKPTIQNTFTDKFGNVLECNDGRALFSFKTTNHRYPVITGNSSYVIQCIGDYNRNRAFLIAGSRRISTLGKLYALDTKEAEVVDGDVITEEITQAGDLISAVAIRPSNGVILLSKEVIEYNLTSYQLVYLKPVHFKFLSTNKFTKQQVRRANVFENAVTKGGEKIYELFVQFWNNRKARLVDENRRLRRLAETQFIKFRYPVDLPGAGKLLDPSLNENDFKAVLGDFKHHLARVYKKYLLDPKVVEEYRCRSILTRLRTRVANYLGKLNVKEETLVIDASTLGLAKRVDSTARVLAIDHEINVTNTYIFVESPSYIFPEESSYIFSKETVLRVLIGGDIFSFGNNFGPMDYERPYDGYPAIPKNFTDRFGHKLLCGEDGQVFFEDQKRCPLAMCPVVTGESYFVLHCILDYERNRAFIISSEKTDAAKGRLFVFDTEAIILDGTFIHAEQIKELGDNITAVSFSSATGDIYVTEEVIASNRKAFNVVVLKPITKAPSPVTSRIVQRTQRSVERPITHQLDGNEFVTTMNANVTKMVNFHNKNWLRQMQELINEHNELKKVLPTLYVLGESRLPHANITSFILSELSNSLKDSWNLKLNKAITENLRETFEVYERQLLRNTTRGNLDAHRKCMLVLTNLQTKGRSLLSDILAPK